MIYIESKKKKESTLLKKYPNAKFVDVTSKAKNSLVKLSPFYPHGNIPIPFTEDTKGMSVEGIWQALKVFESADIDLSVLDNDTMRDIKRTTRKFGKILGHRKGINGVELLNYLEARIEIYLPTYLWVLTHKLEEIISRLKEASNKEDIVLLDYDTNSDVLNPKKPLSHASLVKAYVEGNYPTSEYLYQELSRRATESVDFEKKPKKLKSKSAKEKQKPIDNNQTTLFNI